MNGLKKKTKIFYVNFPKKNKKKKLNILKIYLVPSIEIAKRGGIAEGRGSETRIFRSFDIRSYGRWSRASSRTFFFLSSLSLFLLPRFLELIVYLVADCFLPPSSCSSREKERERERWWRNRSIREIFIVFRV